MKRRELYTGDKPFVYIDFSYVDTILAESLIAQLDSEGYRYWFNTKLNPNDSEITVISERLNSSAITVLVLSDSALRDDLVMNIAEQTLRSKKTLILYVQMETGAINEYINMMHRDRRDVVIHREYEMPILTSHRMLHLLSPAKGLSTQLAETYYTEGLRIIGDPNSTLAQKNEAYGKILLACENEYPQAEYLIGRLRVTNAGDDQAELENGTALMRSAAEKGDLNAIYSIGCMLEDGEVFEKDPQAALSFLSIAAVYNVPDAQYRVAGMLESGVGTPQDTLSATSWYLKALENGDRRAYIKLAYVYLRGEILKKDEVKAFKYFTEAERDGDADAGLMLAKMYRDGIGTERDEKKAEHYFMLAADKGIKEAEYNYALCLAKKKNTTEAYKWLSVASGDGDPNDPVQKDVLYEMGNFYSKGIGVDKDKALAFTYYYKAMKLGHEEAKYEVANCYRKGIGVPVNKRAAVYFNPKYAEDVEE